MDDGEFDVDNDKESEVIKKEVKLIGWKEKKRNEGIEMEKGGKFFEKKGGEWWKVLKMLKRIEKRKDELEGKGWLS